MEENMTLEQFLKRISNCDANDAIDIIAKLQMDELSINGIFVSDVE